MDGRCGQASLKALHTWNGYPSGAIYERRRRRVGVGVGAI